MRRAAVATAWAGCLLFWAAALFVLADALFPVDALPLRPPLSVRVLDREGAPLRFFLADDEQWRFFTPLEDISPLLIRAVIASEDRYFRYHPGVNPLAVARAALANLLAGRVVSGGSTIPMQIARMAEPRERTLWAKCVETFRALQLCRRYTGDELLELYLNMAPYGGNVAGIGAGAWFVCSKTPAELSLAEAALLTALPRAPNGYRPDLHPQAARAARDRVLRQLVERGGCSAEDAATAARAPLPRPVTRAPLAAPHFSRLAVARAARTWERASDVATSLDRKAQTVVERVLAGRAGWLRRQNLANAAAVVLDVRTREVLAMAGSLDFHAPEAGQMNLTLAERSPGSTLKPFLYALAMDQGRIIPATRMLDLPTDFAGYVASNYDDTYSGRVTARDGLATSLNAPAVRLLARVGVSDFLDLLRRGGLSTLDGRADRYGLPLALGGCEVRLVDLVNLYATLASDGVHRTWTLERTEGEGSGPVVQLLGKESCRLVLEVLQLVERPDLPRSWDLARDVPAVAWKTGTSFGHRDAWAVGVSGRLAIGVWVGNPDGTPRQSISGATHAGPLLFDLFRGLERTPAPLPAVADLDLERAVVCAVSGKLAGPDCPQTIVARIIPGRTELTRCDEHRRIFVDADTGDLLSGDCLARRPAVMRVVHTPPPELTAWRLSRGDDGPALPGLSPTCAAPDDDTLRILSPDPQTPYKTRRWAPDDFQRIALLAQTRAGSGTLHWYLDGELAARIAPGEKRFIRAMPGTRRIVVLDEAGRMDAVTFTVQ